MQRKAVIFPVLLSAITLLSACAAPQSAGIFTEEERVRTEISAAVDSGEPTPAEDAVTPKTNAVTTDAADETQSAESLEQFSFSSRDFTESWDDASAVRVTLNGDSVSCDADSVTLSGSTATITAAGTYVLSGSLDDGSIIVDAGKEDKVQLVLNGVSIRSSQFAAIYVKQADKVFVTLADGAENVLSNGGAFRNIDENDVDGVIFSKDDLTFNGDGKLTVTSPAKHGVVSKDDLAITGGTYEITAASHALSGKDGVGIADGTFTLNAGKDGVHSSNDEDAQKGNVYIAGGVLTINAGDDGVTAPGIVRIDGGTLDITGAEGLEGTYICINDGVVRIQASDDGINATRKSADYTPTIEINGGEIRVVIGPGDTDGIDANGNLIITGGLIDVTGNSAFDIDGSVTFTGGTVTVNGQQVTEIPNQFGGRGGFGGGNRMPNDGGFGGEPPTPNDGAAQVPGGGTRTPNGNGAWPNQRGGKRGGQYADGSLTSDAIPHGNRGGKTPVQSGASDATTSATPKTAI